MVKRPPGGWAVVPQAFNFHTGETEASLVYEANPRTAKATPGNPKKSPLHIVFVNSSLSGDETGSRHLHTIPKVAVPSGNIFF